MLFPICKFAKKNKIDFLETSAKEGENVAAAFSQLARSIKAKIEQKTVSHIMPFLYYVYFH